MSFAFLPADIVTQILNFGLPSPVDIQISGNKIAVEIYPSAQLFRGFLEQQGLFVFLLIVLELLTIVSQQDRKITTLAQMVGMPMTLLSLLTTSDVLAESGSEDPSMLPQVPELRPFSALHLRVDGHTIPHLPVLAAFP